MKHTMGHMETTNWILLKLQRYKQFFCLHGISENAFESYLTNILRTVSKWAVTEAVGLYFVKRLKPLYQYALIWLKLTKIPHKYFI